MKCHHCQVQIEVQTDPQNRDYALTKGIHRVKAEDWNPEDTNTIKLMGEGEQNAIRIDPFKKLEHLQEDLEFADDEKVQLLDLQELRDRLAADDYDKNYALRKTFRDKKKRNRNQNQRICRPRPQHYSPPKFSRRRGTSTTN